MKLEKEECSKNKLYKYNKQIKVINNFIVVTTCNH